MANPGDKLRLAQRHLERVLAAWDTPTDWDDLSIYGLYGLEAAVEAAASHVGLTTSRKHWEKAEIAGELHKRHGLPDVEQRLDDLDKPLSPTEAPCGQVLRWPTARSRDWTNTFVESAEGNLNIVAVVAVGSAVRPRAPSADIDLVVVCRDPSVLKVSPPLEVDLRAYSAAEIDTGLRSGHDLLGWAVSFGRLLYQRECFWDRVLSSWGHRLPLPSSKLARERAAAAHRRLTKVADSDEAGH